MRRWLALSSALLLAIAAAAFVKHRLHRGDETDGPIIATVPVAPEEPPLPAPPPPKPLRTHREPRDIDLTRIRLDDSHAEAPLRGGDPVRLTLHPGLQRTAETLLAKHHLAEAAIVMMDVATGHVLVYASRKSDGPPRDLAAEATAPAASVFKIVTAAALVEDAHLGANSKKCYAGGGERGIHAHDLVEDATRDTVCTTLGTALAKSTNVIFARLALEHLSSESVESMARKFGFGSPVPFDVAVQPSTIHIPDGDLELARTAAGFWNTTLSPLEAAWMSATIANHGTAIPPSIVESTEPVGPVSHPVSTETADAVRTMMERTVTEGTSYKTFHAAGNSSWVNSAGVAGKTGTLSSQSSNRFFTWFTGFAPTHSSNKKPPVAIAALVVNGPTWDLKANVVARDMLRAYLVEEDETEPPTKVASVARRRRQ